MGRVDRRAFLGGAAGVFATARPGGLSAQGVGETPAGWPTRPIRFVVPLAPGGGLDAVARGVAEAVSRLFGYQIVIENRTGAGGTLGMDLALKSAPDGYTVLISNDNAASSPHIMGLSYDYTNEMRPVILFTRQPQVFAVHPSLGAATIAEYVAYARANPGLGFATSGVGSNQHVIGEWFKREAGLKLDHVPYRGAGQAINDLLAGHVKSGILGPTAVLPHHKSGALRMLAQTSGKRALTLPEIPTLDESGFKGVVLESWFGAFVPPGTPDAIVARLNADMDRALTDETLRRNLTAAAFEPVGGAPQELGRQARADSEKYARLVKELNIRPNYPRRYATRARSGRSPS